MDKIKLFMVFSIMLLTTVLVSGDTKFIDTSGDEVVSINSSGSIGGVGNITFLDSTNGYGFFRNLGNSITNIIEGWFENMFISGNATINGSIWGRDYPQSTLLSCNFDGYYTCDGGESAGFTAGFDGLWHMEEGTGTKVFDESDNVYHADFVNSPVWNSSGKYGSGIEFNGDNTYLTTNSQGDIQGTDDGFTTGGWAYMKGDSTFNAGTIIGNIFTVITNQQGYNLRCAYSTSSCRFQTRNNIHSGDATIPLNTWVFVVGVMNTTDTAIYINGTLASFTAKGTFAGSQATTGIGGTGIIPTIWNGTLDEVFFTNEILTAEEILLLYNSRWSGTSFLDSNKGDFNKGHYAMSQNLLSYKTSGNLNKEQGSISMWVKNGWEVDDGNLYTFFSTGNGTSFATSNNELRIWKHTNKNLYFTIVDSAAATYHLSVAGVLTPSQMPSNQWNHIVVTWNASGTRYIYLNYDLSNSNTNAGAFITTVDDLIQIGNLHWSKAHPAKSLIDDLQIFNRPLTSLEVERLFRAGRMNVSVTSNIPHLENNIFSAYTNANSATFTSTAVELVFDTLTRKNSLYVNNISTDISFRKSGDYMLNMDCSIDVDSGSARSTARCYPTLNNVEIDGTRCFTYNRIVGNADQTCSVNRIVSLSKGDVISVEAVEHTGTDTLIATADGSRINLEYKP